MGYCRVPVCSSKPFHHISAVDSSEKNQQRLFLCKHHLEAMKKLILKVYRRNEKQSSGLAHTHYDIGDYRSLIDDLEDAFVQFMDNSSILSLPDKVSIIIAEVLLNTRNYLVIVSTLLHQDEDHIKTILGLYLVVFKRFLDLSNQNEPEVLKCTSQMLQEVMTVELFCFGILYAWIPLRNPGAEFGSFIGTALGFAGAVLIEPVSFIGVIGITVAGMVAGNFIGSGGYDLYRQGNVIQQQEELIEKCQEFVLQNFGHKPSRKTLLYLAPAKVSDSHSLEITLRYLN